MDLEELRERYPAGMAVLVDGRYRGTVLRVEATWGTPLVVVHTGAIPLRCEPDEVAPLAGDELAERRARHRRP